MRPLGIYLHIPFCLSKCPYCDFYSVVYTQQAARDYAEALVRAVKTSPARGSRVDSVYFGGGTPVLLGKELLPILQAVAQSYELTDDCEITLEANPAAMTYDTLCALRQGGFNRISMGVQSANDRELQDLGRRHSFEQAVLSVQLAQQAGFGNVSVDLMLGTPHQTAQSIRKFVETFDALGVQHISGYLLKIEPGTPFARQQVERLCPGEEESADLYLDTVGQMERHGFLQYEVSNFARPGFESRHNLKYWRCEEYLGIGPAAHSYWNGRRFYFPRSLSDFCAAEDVWKLVEQDGEGGGVFEYVMLRLRLREGVRLDALRSLFGTDTSALERRAGFLQKQGLVRLDGETLSLTPQGFLVSNSVIVDLLDYC